MNAIDLIKLASASNKHAVNTVNRATRIVAYHRRGAAIDIGTDGQCFHRGQKVTCERAAQALKLLGKPNPTIVAELQRVVDFVRGSQFEHVPVVGARVKLYVRNRHTLRKMLNEGYVTELVGGFHQLTKLGVAVADAYRIPAPVPPVPAEAPGDLLARLESVKTKTPPIERLRNALGHLLQMREHMFKVGTADLDAITPLGHAVTEIEASLTEMELVQKYLRAVLGDLDVKGVA